MRILEKQVEALMRLCTAEEESERSKAREEVCRMMQVRRGGSACADPEYLIREVLLNLGAPDHLVGHPYTVQAVLLVVQDRSYIDNITYGLYPYLALIYDTTATRVERAIRHLIEVTWSRGDVEMLALYFGNTVSPDKGKPTNGEFIARVANLVKQRIRAAA